MTQVPAETNAKLAELGWTLLFLAGVAIAAYGLWLAWHPLGFVGAGVVVALLGYGGGLEHVAKTRQRQG